MKEKIEQKVNFYTNLTFFIVVVLFVGVRICSYYNLFSFMGTNASYYMSLVVQIGLIFLFPVFFLGRISKSRTKEVFQFSCYKKTSWKILFAAVFLGVIVFFLNVYVSNFFNTLISFFGYKHQSAVVSGSASWITLLLDLVCTAVLPAICEETLNRGIMLNGSSMLGMKKSVLLTGLLFGLLHMNIEQFFYATLIGFLLGYICWGCGSIFPCMVVHFMNNALSVFFSFAAKRGWAIGNIFTKFGNFISQNSILGLFIFLFVMFLLVYVGFVLLRYMIAQTVKNRFARRQTEFAKFAMRETYLKEIEALKNDQKVEAPLNTIPANEQEFMRYVENNIEKIVESATKFEPPTVKMTTKSKIFLYGSIVLSAAMTILTFVWGIL